MPEAADDILVGGLLEKGRLALELLLRLHVRERHDLDRVLHLPSLGCCAEDKALATLAERRLERPVVGLVLLEGGGDLFLGIREIGMLSKVEDMMYHRT